MAVVTRAWSDMRRYPPDAALLVVGGVGYFALLMWAMVHVSYDVWGALLVFPPIAIITMVIVTRSAVRNDLTADLGLLRWAFVYKVVLGTLVRFVVIEALYHGVADASQYYGVGGRLAPAFRQYDFSAFTQQRLIGTHFIENMTGLLFAVLGKGRLGGFLFFSWLAFMGLFLFYRAFCIAVPIGGRRRYAALLFFWPSLAFWPSSIGKDAWMVFCLGVAAYGAAKLLTRQRGGVAALIAGMAASAAVRPHVTLALFIALCAAYLIAAPRRGTVLGPVFKAIGVLALVVGGFFVLHSVQSFFKLDSLDPETVQTALQNTQERTIKGGSGYDPVSPTSPQGVIMAPITVLFRPFPFEAHNSESFIASAEATMLAVLVLLSLRRLGRLRVSLRQVPYLTLCLVFVVVFTLAFANIGNFGILARERTQVLPFVFALLALPMPTAAVIPPLEAARLRRPALRSAQPSA